MKPFCFDFETQAIEPRPHYPPYPVGLAVEKRYLAWGHPSGNNTQVGFATLLLEENWKRPLLCHNAGFDIAVAHEKLHLPLPDSDQVHDTMFLAFLLDPYGDLGLKPLAERYLGMPPTERDAVRDWLYENKIVRRNTKKWGAHISKAPGELVGTYAIGDVTRTLQLFDKLYPQVVEAGMLPAYQREQALLPMLLDNSARGIPLDTERLAFDTGAYEEIFKTCERALRRYWPSEIGGTPPANFDSGDELAEALERNPAIRLPKTPTGRTSTAKDTLMAHLPDGRVKGLLLYRSAIEKCLSTYMRPWLAQGEALHASWNQVRNYDDEGARTGRLSSSPNLQNLTNPEKYEELYKFMREWGCAYSWVKFPNLRSYLVAPKGMVLFSRDYSQQELRLLAHYEDGTLAEAYRQDPDLDLHVFVRDLIRSTTGVQIERKPTKTINFGKVYGMGVRKLGFSLGISEAEASQMMSAYDTALPSVRQLQRQVSDVGRRGEHITTLGGRRYFSPPASFDPDTREVRTWEYKLLNYLIQGGSADQTKEAMRLWWQCIRDTDTRFLLTVHDQLVGCCPKKKVRKASALLDDAMRSAFTLDVPVKTDPTYGYNFGEMQKEIPQ